MAVRETLRSPVLGSVTQAERLASESAARLRRNDFRCPNCLYSLVLNGAIRTIYCNGVIAHLVRKLAST